jgi:hypothetical protein
MGPFLPVLTCAKIYLSVPTIKLQTRLYNGHTFSEALLNETRRMNLRIQTGNGPMPIFRGQYLGGVRTQAYHTVRAVII